MIESDVMYLPEAAKVLGKTETSLRAMIQRAEKLGRRNTLPPYFKVGGKWAMTRSGVKSWLSAQKKGGAL